MDLNATEHTLWIGWIALCLLSPLSGWLLAKHWLRLSDSWRRAVGASSFLSLTLACCSLFAPWSLRGFWANALNLGLAYIALSLVIWLAFKDAGRWLSLLGPLLANVASIVPILICLVFAGDQIPRREVFLGDHLLARIYERGFAGNDFDQVTIVHQPRWFPFVEKTIYSRSIPYGECETTTARLVSAPAGGNVQIVCGERVIETIAAPSP